MLNDFVAEEAKVVVQTNHGEDVFYAFYQEYNETMVDVI
jgi:hypothetical protein